MRDFFVEGGWSIYPVLLVGLILLASSGRYAIDLEPIRSRFIAALSLSLGVSWLRGSHQHSDGVCA
jgi:hypothetical protein